MAGVLLAVNFLGALMITAREMHEHTNINNQLEEYEKKFDSGSLSTEELELKIDNRF